MTHKRRKPKFNRYKFYKTNLWGKIFTTKDFREKEVLFARLNRRLTTKALEVNPVKLRQKRLSVQGRGLFTKYLLKRFYFNYKEYQFRRLYRNKINIKLPFYKSQRDSRFYKKTDLRNNKFIGTLESTVSNILLRSGFFKTPHEVRQAMAHNEITVDGVLVKSLHAKLRVGQHLSFAPALKKHYKLFLTAWLTTHARKRKKLFKKRKLKKMSFSPICRFISPIGNSRYLVLNPRNVSMTLLYKPQVQQVYFPFSFDIKDLNAHYKNL